MGIANAEQCAHRKISTRSFDATILVACAPPLVSDKSVSEPCSIKKGKFCTGVRDLNAPWRKHLISVHAQKHFRWVFVNYISKFGVISSRPKIEPFSDSLFLVFECFAKTACNVGGNNREPLIDIEQTGPRGRLLWYFSAGEMTLWNVDRQHTHSTTFLKGCNLSHFLLQRQV